MPDQYIYSAPARNLGYTYRIQSKICPDQGTKLTRYRLKLTRYRLN